jgi:LacI family transcriptional regulator
LARRRAQILASCDGRVDGIILLGPDVTPAFAETLHQHTPFVAIHSNQTLPPHACNLSVDNEGGAYAAVRHLLARGHRRIAHVTGGESADAVRRRAGYRRALEAAGVAADEALILPGDFHIGSGRRVMTELLDNRHGASLPTAIFCASDAIAYGCMEVLAARGLRAPRDLSVVGFDDVLLARMTSPPLTTVRQPLRAMGARAVELLLSQIHGPAPEGVGGDATAAPAPAPDPVPATEVFAVELVLRDSVGPPPHR